MGKLAIFVRFSTEIAVYLETVRERPMVTMERYGINFDDLE